MAHDVFISHSTKDRDVTEKVCRALEDAGYEYWVSFEDIPPGASWPAFVTEAITAAPVMVVILTANSNTSK